MTRADLGRERWICRAIVRALAYIAEGEPDDSAADLAMRAIAHDSSVGQCGGIGLATRRAAERAWDAWTAELLQRLRARCAAPASTISLADIQIGAAS